MLSLERAMFKINSKVLHIFTQWITREITAAVNIEQH